MLFGATVREGWKWKVRSAEVVCGADLQWTARPAELRREEQGGGTRPKENSESFIET